MLSYRHGFHAGNAADLLKHAVLVLGVEHLRKKDKGFCVLDTHAGGGIYDLQGSFASKNAEYLTGLGRVCLDGTEAGLPPSLLAMLRDMNPGGDWKTYPGSPEIARRLLRPQDQLVLMEMHNNEVETLRDSVGWDERVAIHHRDGFEGLVALVPPALRRGLVLMDPSYELKEDYARAVKCLRRAFQRWSTGIYVLWYPLLAKPLDRSAELLEGLAASGFPSLWHVELETAPPRDDWGMHGSGLAIVNPPWQLDEQIAAMMPPFCQALGPAATYRSGWLVRDKD